MASKHMPRAGKDKKAESSNAAPASITIEFPTDEELITLGHYAIRIAGAPEAQVEISINEGEWIGCRTAAGYYWFDWNPIQPGTYQLMARQRVGKGRPQKSTERVCHVVKG